MGAVAGTAHRCHTPQRAVGGDDERLGRGPPDPGGKVGPVNLGVDGRTFTVAEPGGAVQVGLAHTERLVASDDEVVLFGHERVAERFPDVPVDSTGYLVDSIAFGLAWEQAVLPGRCRRHGVDVLFCPNVYCPFRDVPFRTVVMIQGLGEYHGFGPCAFALFRRTVLPRVVEAADTVVTVSEFCRRDIHEQLDVPLEDVEVVYNGVDDTFLDPDAPASPIDLPDEYVLYVGAMSDNKNVENAVRGFARMKAEHDLPHHLVLVGGTDNPTTRSTDLPGSGDDVRQYGYVADRPELKYAYENAAAFVFPSLYESFGMPPLEAMACGTPVVASPYAALEEVLADGAHFVDPEDPDDIADGLHRVLTDEEYAAALQEAGRNRAQEFTWQRAANWMQAVLHGES